jgi:tetratricopeptide (TPR) repeat protein
MKTLNAMLLGWMCILSSPAAVGTAAEVRPLEFVHALQEKGYHDIAVEYLNMLKQRQLPPEVAAIWDLEMSKSLRGSANRAFNPKDFEEQMAEAQKHLDKFLKENPTHAEAVTALVSSGTFSIDRALQHLRAGKAASDKGEKAKHQAEARKALDEARPRLKQAVETLQKRFAEAPVPEVKPKRSPRADREARAALQHRADLLQGLLDARFQAAMADYYTAQTYSDPQEAGARKALLQNAAKQLDDIYQANRVTASGQVNVVGLYAHMWHGKIAEELGDLRLAQDIYEEVLANDPGPNPSTADKVLDPLFSQVQHFYFAIIAQRDGDQFLEEATAWLKDYSRKSRRTEGYQAIALEVAKARLDLAAKATGAAKNKLTAEAVALLNDMVNVPSPYQQEAWTLRKQYSKVDTSNIKDAKTAEEAAAIAQAAASVGQWPEAVAAFTRAIELASTATTKDPKRIAELRQSLSNAKVMMAGKLYSENKMEECLEAVGKIIQEDKTAPAAEAAASLGVEAVLSMVVSAGDQEERQAALQRLEKVCKMTEDTWPGRPPADDARMAMAQVKLASGQVKEALDVFEKINPKSERYPLARYLAGRTYWLLYAEAKRQGAGAEKLAADRAEAVKRAVDALARFRKAAEPSRPLTPQHIESQLLVAVIHLEAKEFKEAAELLRPLVDQVKASKPQALDEGTVRIFRAALQAYLGLNDVARASEVGTVLAELGADNPPVNAVLVDFARVLDEQRKTDEADVTRANASGDAKAAEAANAKLKSTQTLIGNLLKKLASRKEHSVLGLINLGDLCVNVGLAAEATQLYQRVLAIPDVDTRAATRARAQLIGLLRTAGKFQEAIDQARKLATDNPRALEPQLELGRCLQARAEQDPTTYEEAIGQWTRIRNFLQPMRKKPPEYYEVIYSAAWCLYAQGYQTQEKVQERCTEAIQLLTSAMVLNEKLSGPDMVEKYKVLLDTIKKYQQESGGAAPAAESK